MIDLLYSQHISTATPADFAEHWLASVPIPAMILGLNGTLRVNMAYSNDNSGNLKFIRLYFGGVVVYLDDPSAQQSHSFTTRIRNLNSYLAQLVSTTAEFTPFGVTPNVPIAVDTTRDQLLTFTGQLTSPGDTLSLDSFTVEYLRVGP